MSREHTNELEERRVIRLLAGLADGVPALPDAELRGAVAAAPILARTMSLRGRSRRPARTFSAVAAAAVVALAFVIQFEAASGNASSAASGGASIASFPEGNALKLLLSPSETR